MVVCSHRMQDGKASSLLGPLSQKTCHPHERVVALQLIRKNAYDMAFA